MSVSSHNVRPVGQWATKEDFVRDWVMALRSGVYSQTSEKLRNGDSFCCLGVACDIWNPDGWRMGGGQDVLMASGWKYSGSSLGLPPEIRDFLELTDGEAYLPGEDDALTYKNDTLGWSFDQIADLLEEKYL